MLFFWSFVFLSYFPCFIFFCLFYELFSVTIYEARIVHCAGSDWETKLDGSVSELRTRWCYWRFCGCREIECCQMRFVLELFLFLQRREDLSFSTIFFLFFFFWLFWSGCSLVTNIVSDQVQRQNVDNSVIVYLFVCFVNMHRVWFCAQQELCILDSFCVLWCDQVIFNSD